MPDYCPPIAPVLERFSCLPHRFRFSVNGEGHETKISIYAYVYCHASSFNRAFQNKRLYQGGTVDARHHERGFRENHSATYKAVQFAALAASKALLATLASKASPASPAICAIKSINAFANIALNSHSAVAPYRNVGGHRFRGYRSTLLHAKDAHIAHAKLPGCHNRTIPGTPDFEHILVARDRRVW